MRNRKLVSGEPLTFDALRTHTVAVLKPEKKRLTVFGVEFVYLYLFGIGVAAVGWIAENIVKMITDGIFDCRFHLLPFISPYALIPIALHILLGDPDNISFFGRRIFKKEGLKYKILSNVLCLVTITAAVFLGELAIGNFWEKVFGVELWNYSGHPLHVTQYAGLIPALGCGVSAYLIFRFVYKPLLKAIRKIDFSVAKTVCCTLGVLIVLDTLFMGLQIIILRTPPVYWSIRVR